MHKHIEQVPCSVLQTSKMPLSAVEAEQQWEGGPGQVHAGSSAVCLRAQAHTELTAQMLRM